MAIKVINTSAIFTLIWIGLYVVMWIIAIAIADDLNPIHSLNEFVAGMGEFCILSGFIMVQAFPKCEILTHPIAALCLVCHFLIVFWDKIS